MAGRLHRIDYCRQRVLRVNRVLDLPSPLAEVAAPGATSLGCHIPISHASAGGVVVTRANQQSALLGQTLLPSADSSDGRNVGPTDWLDGMAANPFPGTVAYPYPVDPIVMNFTCSLNGAPFFGDLSSGSLPVPSVIKVGFGANTNLIRTCIVPDGAEFVVSGRPKALHHQRFYAKVATVTSDQIPLAMAYNLTGDNYTWPSPNGVSVKQTSGTATLIGSPGYGWSITLRLWACWPAHIGHGPNTLTPAPFSENNGPLLDRRYAHNLVDDRVYPSYGGLVSSAVDVSGFRGGTILYARQTFTGDLSPDTTVLINDTPLSFSGASIPSPQNLVGGDADEYMIFSTTPTVGEFTLKVQSPHNVTFLGLAETHTIGTITIAVEPINSLWVEGLILIAVNHNS